MSFHGFVKVDSVCECSDGTILVIGPLADCFICGGCTALHKRGKVAEILLPLELVASTKPICFQNVLIECSGKTLGVADMFNVGDIMTIRKWFGFVSTSIRRAKDSQ